MQLKKLQFLLRYVPDQYKTQRMCGKSFLKNGPTLMSVIKYVIKQLIITYPHALEFVLECYKTQKMCDKAIGTYPYTIQSVPESY